MGHERMTHCFKPPALLANAWEQAGKLAGSNGLCRTIVSARIQERAMGARCRRAGLG